MGHRMSSSMETYHASGGVEPHHAVGTIHRTNQRPPGGVITDRDQGTHHWKRQFQVRT